MVVLMLQVVVALKESKKANAELQAQKMKSMVGKSKGNHFEHLRQTTYEAKSEVACMQWVTAIQALVAREWQKLCESMFINNPEIFQFREFICKIKNQSKVQPRLLVVSNSWMYNVESTFTSPLAIKEVRAPTPFVDLLAFACHPL